MYIYSYMVCTCIKGVTLTAYAVYSDLHPQSKSWLKFFITVLRQSADHAWSGCGHFCLTLIDQFDRELLRDIVSWLLTSKNILSWPLALILTTDEDRSTQHIWVPSPWCMHAWPMAYSSTPCLSVWLKTYLASKVPKMCQKFIDWQWLP